MPWNAVCVCILAVRIPEKKQIAAISDLQGSIGPASWFLTTKSGHDPSRSPGVDHAENFPAVCRTATPLASAGPCLVFEVFPNSIFVNHAGPRQSFGAEPAGYSDLREAISMEKRYFTSDLSSLS